MKKTFYNDVMTYNETGIEFKKELQFLFPLVEKYIKLDYNVSEIRDFVSFTVLIATIMPSIIHSTEKFGKETREIYEKEKIKKSLKKEIKELLNENKTQIDDPNIWSYELKYSGNGAFEEVKL